MKKIIKAIAFFTLSFSAASYASISVGISNNLDTFSQVLSSPDNPGGIGAGSIWQLIWTPDNSVSPIDDLNPLDMQEGEILLDQFNGDGQTNAGFTDLAGGFMLFNATTYNQPASPNGFVYARVFDFAGSGSPGPSTWYEETAVFSVNDQTTPSPSTTVTFGGPVVMSQQVMIPEPSTLILVLAGLLGVVGFRRKSQK